MSDTFYWDDLRVSATMMAVDDFLATQSPKFTQIICNKERGCSYSGVFAYTFAPGCNNGGKGLFQNAHFHVQLPHTYKQGSAIEPHVHVRLDPHSEARAGQQLLLELEYTWTNIDEPRPEGTEIVAVNYTVKQQDLERDNIMIVFPFLEKENARISSMLSCRFSRITIGDGWPDFWSSRGLKNDNFVGAMVLKEFDFHFQVDGPGSSSIHKK